MAKVNKNLKNSPSSDDFTFEQMAFFLSAKEDSTCLSIKLPFFSVSSITIFL